jgi:hypothetical protein
MLVMMFPLHIAPEVIAPLVTFAGAVALFVYRKNLEKTSINKAILAEIKRLVEVVERHQKWWEERIQAKDTNHPLILFSHAVYAKQVDNIGALQGSLVVRVVQFYGYLDFLNALQASRPHYIAAKKSNEFDHVYNGALKELLKNFGQAFASEFEKLR